ncbi:glutamate-cysteine ligase family protein [Amycolatopsis albispora]|uniref:Glutamate--cysteine ligase EgtA n=1 Tax=Amycolatopsis albispora TaxID=1804986 RepID=A0A344L4R0_9PSEU|nr:glutamate-cysteine ligase family protein [Amycolatopsis albispora]AXB43034.1 ergothioneine biosynthesis glutamate--cysteine ligase EgtA [Amycolatopsis albispora]
MTTVRDFPSPATGNLAARVVSDRAEGEAYVASVCFKHGPPRLLGVELEYTVHHRDDPSRPLDPGVLAAALGPHTPRTLDPGSEALPLPGGSPVTLEPGGQVEISPLPRSSLAELAGVVDAELTHLTELLARSGLELGTSGIDAHRAPRRFLETPRYAAMERRFAPDGPGGITMMCSTAGLQVCVDAGEAGHLPSRWAAAHEMGPALLALFANSGRHAGRDTGHASARWLAVMATERARTFAATATPDPPADWARRMLDTPLLVVPRADGPWDAPVRFTFADWIDGRGEAGVFGRPTLADLDYHLTTMFTPVRPQGYLEIRYLDAQPPRGWLDATALLVALLAQPSTVDKARELCEPVAGAWETAASRGLADPAIAGAAKALADLGCAALGATGLPSEVIDRITEAVQHRAARTPAPRTPEERA